MEIATNTPTTTKFSPHSTSSQYGTANLNCNEMSNKDERGESRPTNPAYQLSLDTIPTPEQSLQIPIHSQQKQSQLSSDSTITLNEGDTPQQFHQDSKPISNHDATQTQLQHNSNHTSSEVVNLTLTQLQSHSKPTSSDGVTQTELQTNLQLKPSENSNPNPTSP